MSAFWFVFSLSAQAPFQCPFQNFVNYKSSYMVVSCALMSFPALFFIFHLWERLVSYIVLTDTIFNHRIKNGRKYVLLPVGVCVD